MSYCTTACACYINQEFPFLEIPQTCGIYRAMLVHFMCGMCTLTATLTSPYLELAGGLLVVGVGGLQG